MRCRITAILRARATFARFEPRRLATSIAQRLSFENRVMRASRTLAASYSAVRTISSPARVVTNDREHSLVQLFVFRLQSYPRRKHRPGNAFQGGLARHQLPNPRIKAL